MSEEESQFKEFEDSEKHTGFALANKIFHLTSCANVNGHSPTGNIIGPEGCSCRPFTLEEANDA